MPDTKRVGSRAAMLALVLGLALAACGEEEVTTSSTSPLVATTTSARSAPR